MTKFVPTTTSHLHDGTRDVYKFGNGYGASVISHRFSYGGDAGLYELAVLDPNGDLTYETPITDDVIGWLTEDDVQACLAVIAALKGGNDDA